MEKDTENKILQAAEEEFMTKGFAGARTSVIAEKAGVTHAMLHYYYRTKEKLFEKIVNEKFSLISSIVADSFTSTDTSLEEKIRNVIENHLRFITKNPNLPHFLIGELYSGSKQTEIMKQRISLLALSVIKGFQSIISASFEKGECRKVDARMLLLDMISLNVFPFLIAPLKNAVLGDNAVGSEEFLQERIRNNVNIIMNKLRP